MFAAERTRKIKEMLLEYKHVDVNTLCSLLDCSVATVRRDLDKLEGEGFLTKAYGGAILNEENLSQIALCDDGDPYRDDKAAIARIANTLIRNEDIIFIGPGTTCTELAKALVDKQRLTVITNNFGVAAALCTRRDISLVFLGGMLESDSPQNAYTVGPVTLSEISSLFISKAFFTVSGVSLDYGYTVSSITQQELLRTAMKQAEQSYVLADSSKFDRRSMIKLAGIDDLKNVITNVEVSEKYKEHFFSNKVAIYTTFDER